MRRGGGTNSGFDCAGGDPGDISKRRETNSPEECFLGWAFDPGLPDNADRVETWSREDEEEEPPCCSAAAAVAVVSLLWPEFCGLPRRSILLLALNVRSMLQSRRDASRLAGLSAAAVAAPARCAGCRSISEKSANSSASSSTYKNNREIILVEINYLLVFTVE